MPENPLLKTPDGQFIEIDGDSLYLGRDCHLASFIVGLTNKVVSNRHCVLRREGPDRWILEDLGSTNGTWIRSTRLHGKTHLRTGDSFSLGMSGPTFTCFRGFGGTGPDATLEEQPGAPPPRPPAEATMLDPELAGRTILASGGGQPRVVGGRGGAGGQAARDGTMDRPFLVGQTPRVILHHERTEQEFVAEGYTIVLGRDPSAQIVIRSDEEKHISGRHAEIQFRSDRTVVIRDLGSRNGTWVNSRRLKDGEVPLKVGDRIVLGAAATTLRVKQL
ncbi:MAG TPA: FHA domain-containing protein [Gemmatimonadales bacterium]|nr:FHA domain-containing protein [Gemmatimonadales bacterium]